MEWIAKVLIFLICIYWTGDRIKANHHIAQLLNEAEGGFSTLIVALKELKVPYALNFLVKVYGVITLVGFATLFVISKFNVEPGVREVVALIFGTSFLMYSSVNWVIKHKNFVKFNKLIIFIILSWPFFLGGLEFSQGFPILNYVFLIINQFFIISNVGDLSGVSLWWQAGGLTIFSAVIMMFYYIIAWCGALFFTSISVFLILIPVYFAKFIHRVWPHDTFFFFTIILFGILTIFS